MNWGYKIAIVYTLFAGGMIAMLIYSKTFKHELVTEEYYQKELHYQEHIDAVRNMHNAPFSIMARADSGKVVVVVEGLRDNSGIKGRVNLYKPDNRAYDRSVELVLTDKNRMSVYPDMPRGMYRVEVSVEVDGEQYLSEQQVTL